MAISAETIQAIIETMIAEKPTDYKAAIDIMKDLIPKKLREPKLNVNNQFSGKILRQDEKKRFTDRVEFTVTALREQQQKRLESNFEIKNYKNRYKLSSGGHKCPACDKTVRFLEAAHVGRRIMDEIRKIVDEHGERLHWDTFALFEIVKNSEDRSWITICCPACNKKLETN